MPITNDIRKTLTDPTPLYFAAGVIDKIREEAPDRIAAVRETDPKEVQAKFTAQAKETQSKVSETLGNIDSDIKKLREQAQTLALQSVGVAFEYAVKARESYDVLAERGRGAVKTWRGEEEQDFPEVTVERETVRVAQPPAEEPATTTPKPKAEPKLKPEATETKGTKAGAAGEPQATSEQAKTEPQARTKAEQAAKPAAKKTAARKSAGTKKNTPGSDA